MNNAAIEVVSPDDLADCVDALTQSDDNPDYTGMWVDEDGRLVVKAQNGKIVPLEEYYSRALE